jgi:hypothetical protein
MRAIKENFEMLFWMHTSLKCRTPPSSLMTQATRWIYYTDMKIKGDTFPLPLSIDVRRGTAT